MAIQCSYQAIEQNVDVELEAQTIPSLKQIHDTKDYGHIRVAMNLDPPENDMQVWECEIINRLQMDLIHGLLNCKPRARDFATEFFMAGSDSNTLRPTIVITCYHESCRKVVHNILHSLDWLSKYEYAQEVVLERIIYLADLDRIMSKSSVDEAYVELQQLNEGALCGQYLSLHVKTEKMSIGQEDLSVLGGFVVFDERIYGLTTSHGLLNVDGGISTSKGLNIEFKTTAALPSLQRSRRDLLAPSTTSMVKTSHSCNQGSLVLPRDDDDNEASDWALLPIKWKTMGVRNSFRSVSSNTWIGIEGYWSIDRLTAGPVEIVGPRQTRVVGTAYLSATAVSLHIDGVRLSVRRITTQIQISKGISGTWVIRERRLCGYLIAGNQRANFVYMVPIENALKAMQQHLDCGAPSVANDDIVAAIASCEFAPVEPDSQPLHITTKDRQVERNSSGDVIASVPIWDEEALLYPRIERQRQNVLVMEGGGVRSYWTLLLLEVLINYIAELEEASESTHSFHPLPYPENVSQIPLTSQEGAHTDQSGMMDDDQIRELPPTRRYLPCHYFDLICGERTGGLLAILLGRLRMTIQDAKFEFVQLSREIYRRPRKFYVLRSKLRLGHDNKYSAKSLEKLLSGLSLRRSERLEQIPGYTMFESARGLCKTFVWSSANPKGNFEPFLIRSYDRVTSRDHSSPQHPKWKTGKSKKQHMMDAEYEKAQKFEVWQVARVAMVAPGYFKPLRMSSARNAAQITFRDNAPHIRCDEMAVDEVEIYPGRSILGNVVDIGDPRSTRTEKIITYPNLPSYFGFNPHSLKDINMDAWSPRRSIFSQKVSGSQTLADIECVFISWTKEDGVRELLQRCASELVAKRRGRMITPDWERYATGVVYWCPQIGCDEECFDRATFIRQLTEIHDIDPLEGLDDLLDKCRRQWQYQPGAATSRTSRTKRNFVHFANDPKREMM
ncbi:uncharacterized protein KY384_002981 [Bacidia gigantensis]|uniref:uncharacterized protein n=1 Tax=Bacidia gigantensis TaxID=2732470 RepID=UPI001D042948|nr:uncharacterized protein KY384_002981 [Bacidia gigantensis]KAG8531352.1 hypothetical protein KY384_002981 [Bacidia gigantensis]